MIKKTFYSSIFIGIFLLIASSAFAKNISLAWDPSDDPEVTGYRVYYNINSSSLPFAGSGASEGVSPIDVGNNLTTSLSELQDGDIVYFAVTAYNSFGEESEFSNVVASEWIPEIYGPASGETVDPQQVVFSWATAPADAAVTYTLVYGTDPQLKSTDLASQAFQGSTMLAGAAFFGLFAAALPARRKRQAALVLTLAGALFLMVGCGGGGGGGSDLPVTEPPPINGSGSPATEPPPVNGDGAPTSSTAAVAGLTETSYTAGTLQENTTYYWKVVAIDAQGQRRESETRSFTTGAL